MRPGSPVIYRIPTTGNRPIRFTAKDLPATLRIEQAKGVVTGHAPASAGRHVVTFLAENDHGKDERKLTFVVGDKLALTPPMGWNHWSTHYLNISDPIIRNAADEMVKSGMADVGYEYISMGMWTPPQDMGGKMVKKALTPNQHYTYFSLWAMMATPLFFSGDMGSVDDFIRGILCNTEMIV